MSNGPSEGAPERLIFVVDNLDALPSGGGDRLDRRGQGAIGAGAVVVLALDPARLVEALGGAAEARRRFDKWLQVAVNLPGRAGFDGERIVARLLSGDAQPTSPRSIRRSRGRWPSPCRARRRRSLTALAPLAADRHAPPSASSTPIVSRAARTSPVLPSR